jgi:hypothetical protein
LTPLNALEPVVIVGQQGLKIDSAVKIIGEEETQNKNVELTTDNNAVKENADNQATQD